MVLITGKQYGTGIGHTTETLAAPATVCGERLLAEATGKLGRQSTSVDPQARKPAIASVTQPPNGVFRWDGSPFSVARQFVLTAKGYRDVGFLPISANLAVIAGLSNVKRFGIGLRTVTTISPFCNP